MLTRNKINLGLSLTRNKIKKTRKMDKAQHGSLLKSIVNFKIHT